MADAPVIRVTAVDAASAVLDKISDRLGHFALEVVSVAKVMETLQQAMDFGEELAIMSERLGLSVQRVQELSMIAAQSGTNVDAFGTAFRNLAKNIAIAQDSASSQARVFKALGVEIKDSFGNLRDVDEVSQELAKSLNTIGNETVRTAAGTLLFGRAWLEVSGALRTYKEAQEEANKVIAVFGTVSDGSAQAAHKLDDQIKLIAEGSKARLLNEMASGFVAISSAIDVLLPKMGEFSTAMGKTFATDLKDIAKLTVILSSSFEALEVRWEALKNTVSKKLPQEDFDKRIDDIVKRREDALGMINTLSTAYQASGGRGVASGGVETAATANAKAVADALNKTALSGVAPFESAINRLDQELAKLTGTDGGMSELQKANDAINEALRQGHPEVLKYADAWQAAATSLDDARKRIADNKYAQEQAIATEKEFAAADAEVLRIERELQQQRDQFGRFVDTLQQQNDELNFQLSLLGKTSDEIAQITEAHRLDLAIQAQYLKLSIELADEEAKEAKATQARIDEITQQLQMLPALGNAFKNANQAALKSTQDFQNSFAGGWTQAFNAYEEGIKGASIAQQSFNDLTRSMEQLFVSMTKNASSAFKEFGNTILGILQQVGAKMATSGLLNLLGIGSATAGGFGTTGGGILGGLGSIVGSLFGGGGSGFGMGDRGLGTTDIASSIGSLVAANAVPIVGTVLAVGGGLILNWLNSKGGGPKTGGFATSGSIGTLGGYTDSSGRFVTPTDADAQLKTYTDATLKSFNDFAKQFGIKALAGFAQGFTSDPQGKAGNILHTQAFVNGKSVYDVALGDLGRDAKVLSDRIALENKRALIAALQNSDLPGVLSTLFQKVIPTTIDANAADSLLQFATAYQSLYDTFNADPMADALKATENAARGAQAALEDQGTALTKLLDVYDGTGQATADLTKATQDYYGNVVAMIAQMKQLGQAIDDMFAQSIKTYTFAKLDKSGQYGYLQQEAAALTQQLSTTTDATMIDKLTKQIDADMREAFGLLDPSAQKQNADAFIKGAQQVDAIAQKQLEAAEKKTEDNMNKILTAVKTAIDSAALNLSGSAADLSNAAVDLSNASGDVHAAVITG
jgi:lambda family phage tail tape measure protein